MAVVAAKWVEYATHLDTSPTMGVAANGGSSKSWAMDTNVYAKCYSMY